MQVTCNQYPVVRRGNIYANNNISHNNTKTNVQYLKQNNTKSVSVKPTAPNFFGNIISTGSNDLMKPSSTFLNTIDISKFHTVVGDFSKNLKKIFIDPARKMLVKTKDDRISNVCLLNTTGDKFHLMEYNVDTKGNVSENNYGAYSGNIQQPKSVKLSNKNSSNKSKPPYLICDLDGCLVNTSWVKSVANSMNMTKQQRYELFNLTANTDNSHINKYCLDFVLYQLAGGSKLHFLTARESKIANSTINFLEDKTGLTCGKDFSISFRPATNTSKAVDYKKEYISKMMENGENIALAIDDKPEINDMYSQFGISTINWQNEPKTP